MDDKKATIDLNTAGVARVCHEANRGLCLAFGDTSQVPWKDAPANIHVSAIDSVHHALDNPDATPAHQHDNWCAFKRADGWVYGEQKNAAAKTHPCLVPYNELPPEQKAKDYVFQAIVHSLMPKEESHHARG